MKITEFVESHRKGNSKPKAAIIERWNTRVVPRSLHTTGRAGAAAYLESYGRGIAAPKVIELALCAEAMGAPEMAAGFWEKAFSLATGQTERFETGSGDTTETVSVCTDRVRPVVAVKGLPEHMQPGRIATMQPADAPNDRTAYILDHSYLGQPKRDGHRNVVFSDAETTAHQARSTRVMVPFSRLFDEACRKVAGKLGAFVLDGERHYLDAAGGEHRSAAQAATENVLMGRGEVLPIPCYAIFKALYADGKSLLDADEVTRIKAAAKFAAALADTLNGRSDCRVELLDTAYTATDKQSLADRQKAEGREGEVWIRRNCTYTGGKGHRDAIVRTKYVIELKVRVTGFTPTTAAGRLFGAIEVSDLKTGKPLGSVGSGFDATTAKRLLDEHNANPGKLIVQVRAQGYTEGGSCLWHARLIEDDNEG